MKNSILFALTALVSTIIIASSIVYGIERFKEKPTTEERVLLRAATVNISVRHERVSEIVNDYILKGYEIDTVITPADSGMFLIVFKLYM